MSMILALGLAIGQAGPLAQTSTGNAPSASAGQDTTADAAVDAETRTVADATQLMSDGKPAEVIALADRVIAANESRYKKDTRMIFSARSLEETLLYTAMAAKQNKAAVVLSENWATAEFLKGFALVDLNRSDEAKPYFDMALQLAPMNAQILAERGEWFKSRKDWPHALADFEAAASAAEFSPDDAKSFEKRRGWRGMAFVRTEQGRLDEAEKLLRQCLAMDPNDATAAHELDYIKSLRAAPKT